MPIQTQQNFANVKTVLLSWPAETLWSAKWIMNISITIFHWISNLIRNIVSWEGCQTSIKHNTNWRCLETLHWFVYLSIYLFIIYLLIYSFINSLASPIARFMGPTGDPSGADRTQVGPMLAPWALLSVMYKYVSVFLLQLEQPKQPVVI